MFYECKYLFNANICSQYLVRAEDCRFELYFPVNELGQKQCGFAYYDYLRESNESESNELMFHECVIYPAHLAPECCAHKLQQQQQNTNNTQQSYSHNSHLHSSSDEENDHAWFLNGQKMNKHNFAFASVSQVSSSDT